eukprot:SAG31_NODE_39552_length_287_cov_0.904255_1_plen_74_part_10
MQCDSLPGMYLVKPLRVQIDSAGYYRIVDPVAMWEKSSVVGWCAVICVDPTGLPVSYDTVAENFGVAIGVSVRH